MTRSKSSACHSPLADFKPLYDCRGEGQWFEGEGGRVMEEKHSVWMVDGRRRSFEAGNWQLSQELLDTAKFDRDPSTYPHSESLSD